MGADSVWANVQAHCAHDHASIWGITMKVDKAALAEYIDVCALIEETEKDLRRLQFEHEHMATDVVRGSNPNFPYEPRNFRIEGVSYGEYKNPDELKQVQKLLTERREIAKKKRLAVEGWMNSAPPRIARIVRLKFFQRKTWTDVSLIMGISSPTAARMELTRYLKEYDGE